MTTGSVDRGACEGLLGYTEAGAPAVLRYEDRTMHVAMIGKSGFGKTTLLEHMILDDLIRGTGMILLDGHGDLTRRVVARAPAEALANMTVVEVNEDQPYGLNLYECHSSAAVDRTVDNVLAVFKKLFLDERSFHPVIEDGLRSSAYVIIANEYTLAELPLLFTNQRFLRDALCQVVDPYVLSYWHQYLQMSAREQRDHSSPVLNKVTPFLQRRMVRLMVSQQHTTIPFEKVLDRGGSLIFRLAGGREPTARPTVEFLGLVFLSVLSNIVDHRASVDEDQRRRVHLYLDEYHRFATPTTEHMLDEFRKYEIGITVATQGLQKIGNRVPHVSSLVLFANDGVDAAQLAKELDATPQRTKRRMQMRTAPQYKPIRERVWDDDSNERRYDELVVCAERMDRAAKDSKYKLERLKTVVEAPYGYWISGLICTCEVHALGLDGAMLDRNVGHSGSLSNDLVRAALEDRQPTSNEELHKLFNPCTDYFAGIICAGEPCGSRLTASGLTGVYKISRPIPSRRWPKGHADLIDGVLYEGYYLRPEHARFSWIIQIIERELYPADHEWAERLRDELCALLEQLYATKKFYLRVPSKKECSGYWAEWIGMRGPVPTVGTERALIRYPDDWPSWKVIHQWPAYHWEVTYFPEAVRWLRDRIVAMKKEMDEQAESAVRLKHERDAFLEAHSYIHEHKKLVGYLPVKTRSSTTRTGTSYVGGRRIDREYASEERDQWYDEREELDQNHLDREKEHASMLTGFSKYTAYCKLLDASGVPREYRIKTVPPLESAVNARALDQVESASRQRDGTPAAEVESEIKRRRGDDDDPPPIGRRSRR